MESIGVIMKLSKSKEVVLLTGGTGLLGLALMGLRPKKYQIVATYNNFHKKDLPIFSNCQFVKLNIINNKEVVKLFSKIKPNILIHAASLGNVDFCEKNKKKAWQVNVLATRNLISACKNYHTKMIFTSSNAVFDGINPPFKETDQTNPLDYYGKTKVRIEKDLIKSKISYCIVRLMTMYGWNHPQERANPVTWLLEQLTQKKTIKIVNDIYNNHLYIKDAAKAVWQIIKLNKLGIYHIAGSESISRYELSLRVAKIFNYDPGLILPVNSSFFPSLAPRPKNTTFDITKISQNLKINFLNPSQGINDMKNNPPVWEYPWNLL